MSLALAHGCSVESLLNNISSAELSYWLKFYEQIPFGPYLDAILNAHLCSVVANCNRAKGRAFKLTDFLLFGQEPKQANTLEDFLAWCLGQSQRSEPK